MTRRDRLSTGLEGAKYQRKQRWSCERKPTNHVNHLLLCFLVITEHTECENRAPFGSGAGGGMFSGATGGKGIGLGLTKAGKNGHQAPNESPRAAFSRARTRIQTLASTDAIFPFGFTITLHIRKKPHSPSLP